ncbi:hypothetical protein HYS00_05425 [Candidatus Microgenomates bacterium]|nr:hypothetical protein [Candidatus Microgenomates bacterium]
MGWNRDGRSQVMSNAGKIPTGVWNNTEVEFEMPLSVKEGKWQFWVRKSENDSDAQSKLLVSNKVIIEVASRFTYYPTATDSSLERQIKKIKRFLFL